MPSFSLLSTDCFLAMKSKNSSALISLYLYFLLLTNFQRKQNISSLVILKTSVTSEFTEKYCKTSGCCNKGPNSSSSNFFTPSFSQIATSKSYNEVILRTAIKQWINAFIYITTKNIKILWMLTA